MSCNQFPDATLVLLGHGSAKHDGSSEPVFQHAAALRQRNLFAGVREAFWKQSPAVDKVLTEIFTPRIFIVPVFICEGYFTEEVIPRALGFNSPKALSFRITHAGSRTLYYSAPVGTHASMTCVLLARAQEVMTRHPFPCPPKPAETTLFIAGHGTERNENSRRAIEQQAARIRGLNQFAAVHAIFMEEPPRIRDCYGLASTRNVVVVPFFISDGLHTQEDIPMLLGEPERIVRQRVASGQPPWRNPTERHGKRVWYARAVGTEPQIAEVILERVREMAG